MKLHEISWPIYHIGQHDKVYSEFNVDYVENRGKSFILDNKNLKGDTLGIRRLKIKDDKYNFRATLFMISELIEFVRNKTLHNRKFIDSRGCIFTYRKTKLYRLTCHKIKNVQKLKFYVYIKPYNSFASYKVPKSYWRDTYEYIYLIKDINLLYDLSNNPIKDTWRKV
jgi:hypothetical protein